jgi:hypothetical protein
MLVLSLAQPIGLKLREWLKNISGEALRYGVRVRHLLACGKQEFFKDAHPAIEGRFTAGGTATSSAITG